MKLVLHALHENELPFINGGEHVPVPEIPTLLSLGVIIVTLDHHNGRQPLQDPRRGQEVAGQA